MNWDDVKVNDILIIFVFFIQTHSSPNYWETMAFEWLLLCKIFLCLFQIHHHCYQICTKNYQRQNFIHGQHLYSGIWGCAHPNQKNLHLHVNWPTIIICCR
jgi:hypothetical protein